MTYGIKNTQAIRELNDETLNRIAPAIFATSPISEVSAKYTFVPTIDVVNILRDSGWLPVSAEQMTTRKKEHEGFQKHVIKFTRPDLVSTVGDYRAELNLWNSHNKGSAFVLSAGAHRKVCDNGMHVYDEAAKFSHRHIGFTGDQFLENAEKIGVKASNVLGVIDKWHTIELEKNEQGIYAAAAHQFLYGENEDGFSPIRPAQLLETRRFGDSANDLWTTFNVVQENATRGGIRGRNRKGRLTRTRKVKSLDKDRKINEALWALTERMAEIKAA